MSEFNHVYWLCLPMRDGLEALHGDLCTCRKSFFEHNRSPVKIQKEHSVKGFDGRVRGRLSRRGFFWEKTVKGPINGRSVLEEAFVLPEGWLVVTRDLRDVIISRVFFDKSHEWVKSEYYEPWDHSTAKVRFQLDERGMVSRWDWNAEKGKYRSAPLFPAPYRAGSTEQSLVDAQLGEPQLVLYTDKGDMCFCFEGEARERAEAMEHINDGKMVLMPAWEVKDGSLLGDGSGSSITFTSLEEYAKIEPPEDESKTGAVQAADTAEVEEDAEAAAAPKAIAEASEELELLAVDEPDPLDEQDWETDFQPPEAKHAIGDALEAQAPSGFRGSVKEGRLTGHGRVEQPGGLTSYEGDYLDGRRHGFGAYYYKDGSLCYAGSWKDDRRDGLGVSFRGSDHALHVANWSDGQPEGLVTLFDGSGSLRYSGMMVDGKKEGAGVMINGNDGSVFVGQYAGGEATGLGSSFDPQGRLLYYGGWKDGMRHGHGTEFDQDGSVVFDGEFREDKYYNGVLYKKLESPEEV